MNKKFKVKFVNPDELELAKIGFDKTYILHGLEKHRFMSLKIYDLNPAQANILKQTALSSGTDCAVHRETITGNAPFSDCILSGTVSELKKICEKLKYQPFALSFLSAEILSLLAFKPVPINIRENIFDWKVPLIMGIVNVTPDSFSDGGCYFETDSAVSHALELISEGADIIDVGGESTRPYSVKIAPDEEIRRIVPVIEKIREKNNSIPISIDTRNSKTARAALEAGADIINDISALDFDENLIEVAAEKNCPVILNHSKGTPDIMQDNPQYSDILEEIYNYFLQKIDKLTNAGVNFEKLILDPGIGFGKTYEQNFVILRNIEQFRSLKLPLLVGHSRKKFLQQAFNTKDNSILDDVTNIVSDYLISKNVNILRVHNVKKLKQSVDLAKILYS